MMEQLKADFRRKQEIFKQDGAAVSMLRIVMADGSSANIIYRCMRWCATHNLGLLAYFFQWFNKFLNGCVIGSGAEFGPGFVIMHPVGIVINSKVKGDANITLESGVVIGDEKGKSPRLGSEIFVGAGAKIIGGLTVADKVKIGANAVLTKNAEEGMTMLGIPAKPYHRAAEKAEQ
ncbi:serine O-acetyltransferase [Agarivorans sp. MS3-6]|uniref:serine O-acetyltransferase n=1 Tax=Agarivorans sp. TSD2052 TaxID=2937286 RepID=UPI00201075F9|nr:serine acetyltransferase [Agarivorans sp. TSD2052]UPW19200.1 serine acetyltransferase [Agarivorans sp. TSD2052]